MKKILILAANPVDTRQLRLDEEVREIESVYRQARNREEIEIVIELAVRVDDLQRVLLEHIPNVVHFSGHGEGNDGLVLENKDGCKELVSSESLAELFGLCQKHVECVVLNACYSEVQAEAIHQHINCVIGMSDTIEDRAAIKFATGFYRALMSGRNYQDSFDFGRNAIDLKNFAGSQKPQIKIRNSSKSFVEDGKSTIGIVHNLPYSGAEKFVGREDKLELLHQGLTDGQQVVITAIAGMGGIGKTELALQYALQYQNSYPGGVCWLQVRGKELGTQIIDFGRRYLGVNPPDYLELDLEGQVKYCWSHWREGTALIVLDDVPKYGNFYRENILPYLPPVQAQFKVLMTSRQRPDRGICGIDLDVLLPEAALELLKVLAGVERIEDEIEVAESLCKWLGYLPLALELVGRYLDNHPTLTLAKVLSRLESKRLAARALLQQEYGNMMAQSGVAAAFELSWVELAQEAQQLSCLLSLFAPAPFNWELVEQCLPDTDEEDLEDIRDGYLLKFNLLQLTSQNTYRVHPLVREFLQAKLAQLESALQLKQSFAAVMAAIGEKIPETPIRSDIESVKDNIPHLIEVAENLTAAISDKDLIWVFTGLGRFYEGQGLYVLAEPWREQCVSAVKIRLGDCHLNIALSLNNLAFLYSRQGRYSEAELLCQQGLEMRRRLFEDDHPNIATSLNNLAGLYSRQGRYSEAEPLFQQALEMRRQLFEDDHPNIATSLNNLAFLYSRQGKYIEAEPLFQQALEICEKSLGVDHSNTVTVRESLEYLQKKLDGK